VRLRTRRVEDPEINLISLIDILLVLVMFFMLSATFVEEGRLRVHLPQARVTPEAQRGPENIVVIVTQGGGYRVNDRDLVNSGRDTLRAAVLKIAGDKRDVRITLRADGRATHQSVITAMDVLGRLGFGEIDIATVTGDAAGGGKP